MPFSLQDLRLTDSPGDIDVGLPRALRCQNLSTLASLCLRLQRHAIEDLRRRLNVANLIPQQFDAPLRDLLLETLHDQLVDIITLLKGLVEGELADLTSHARLSKVHEGQLVIFDIVACLNGVFDLYEQDTIHLNSDVVLSDAHLTWNFDHLLTQVVHILYTIDIGYLEAEARFELTIELLEAM